MKDWTNHLMVRVTLELTNIATMLAGIVPPFTMVLEVCRLITKLPCPLAAFLVVGTSDLKRLYSTLYLMHVSI